MKQLTQKLKSGEMKVLEVPIPRLQSGGVLVRNHYSLVSTGTEANTVSVARKSLLGKAKERPHQVKQVLDVLQSQGPIQTYRTVIKKLDTFSPLGYSCAGEVIEIADDVNSFQIGDKVACGGITASHAEVVAVPVNLCVRVPECSDMKHAAYNTLGAIAIQGVRQADVRLGETCAVIGLGLIGQLTCMLLRASGIRVIGIDVNSDMVKLAGTYTCDLALLRKEECIESKIESFTGGIGCDAVIITAGTDCLDPVNFAGVISRKRGAVVVVGAVPTGFDREPHYYRKELQLRMSCSYGPGRYDPVYEEKGIDYPPGYVRWTENRNMQAFQELVASGRIDVSPLTTHVFKLDDAPRAYDMILDKSEPFAGILIEYEHEKPVARSKVTVHPRTAPPHPRAVTIGFIGAGSYAQSYLLPNIPDHLNVLLKGVMTASGAGARSAAERHGFEFCTCDANDIMDDEQINTVFIATRHDSHAEYVMRALEAGKKVFVEKPLCLTLEELENISNIYNHQQSSENRKPVLMVGYNRRFSPFMREIKNRLNSGPIAVVYRVNAGAIPPDSWIQDPETGGGRIIGEVCHFMDTLNFLTGSLPVSLFAASIPGPNHLHDTVQICMKYANGAVGTIAYHSNGDKSLPKERIEVFSNGAAAIVEDFKTMTIHSNGNKKQRKLIAQDKGQKSEVRAFLQNTNEMIPFDEIYHCSLAAFKILESLKRGQSVMI